MSAVNLRILIVEDEMLVAFFLEDCLTSLGHTVIGPASRLSGALRFAATEDFDLALLDVNVAGEEIYPAAAEIKSRGIPFVFLSGYGKRGLREDWQDSPLCNKPFTAETLAGCIDAALTA